MSPEIVTIIALVVIFAIATFLPINMGALAFVAAFLVGTLSVGHGPPTRSSAASPPSWC